MLHLKPKSSCPRACQKKPDANKKARANGAGVFLCFFAALVRVVLTKGSVKLRIGSLDIRPDPKDQQQPGS